MDDAPAELDEAELRLAKRRWRRITIDDGPWLSCLALRAFNGCSTVEHRAIKRSLVQRRAEEEAEGDRPKPRATEAAPRATGSPSNFTVTVASAITIPPPSIRRDAAGYVGPQGGPTSRATETGGTPTPKTRAAPPGEYLRSVFTRGRMGAARRADVLDLVARRSPRLVPPPLALSLGAPEAWRVPNPGPTTPEHPHPDAGRHAPPALPFPICLNPPRTGLFNGRSSDERRPPRGSLRDARSVAATATLLGRAVSAVVISCIAPAAKNPRDGGLGHTDRLEGVRAPVRVTKKIE